MKVSLKEAYEHTKKALPGYNVEVHAEIGDYYGDRADGKIKWSLSVRKSDGKETFFSDDEIFAVALANLTVEIKGKEMTAVEDVEVEQDAREKKESVTVTTVKPEEAIKPVEIPF